MVDLFAEENAIFAAWLHIVSPSLLAVGRDVYGASCSI